MDSERVGWVGAGAVGHGDRQGQGSFGGGGGRAGQGAGGRQAGDIGKNNKHQHGRRWANIFVTGWRKDILHSMLFSHHHLSPCCSPLYISCLYPSCRLIRSSNFPFSACCYLVVDGTADGVRSSAWASLYVSKQQHTHFAALMPLLPMPFFWRVVTCCRQTFTACILLYLRFFSYSVPWPSGFPSGWDK